MGAKTKVFKFLFIVSVTVGFSDPNIIAVARKTKISKAGPKDIYKTIYQKQL